MSEGFGNKSTCLEERDAARRQLAQAVRANLILRKLLVDIRPVLITNKHKQMIDIALKTRPPS